MSVVISASTHVFKSATIIAPAEARPLSSSLIGPKDGFHIPRIIINSNNCYIQQTFQAVLSTDGNASFAAFVYKDPDSVNELTYTHQVGFNAGDGQRGANIVGSIQVPDVVYSENLQGVNIFRIDGNSFSFLLKRRVLTVCIFCLQDPVSHRCFPGRYVAWQQWPQNAPRVR